jgi:Holliday junction resolvase RusA-like endonuclease
MDIILDIDPIPCPRPRIMTRGKFAHAYYPKSYKDWKEAAATKIGKLQGDLHTPIAGPLRVSIHCYVTRPKTSKLTHPKPDVDNYAKAVMDALTSAEVWGDDCQVVSLIVTKKWAATGSIHISINPHEQTTD